MWADNGDDCSKQYAGTAALKAFFGGWGNDLFKFLSSFTDGLHTDRTTDIRRGIARRTQFTYALFQKQLERRVQTGQWHWQIGDNSPINGWCLGRDQSVPRQLRGEPIQFARWVGPFASRFRFEWLRHCVLRDNFCHDNPLSFGVRSVLPIFPNFSPKFRKPFHRFVLAGSFCDDALFHLAPWRRLFRPSSSCWDWQLIALDVLFELQTKKRKL